MNTSSLARIARSKIGIHQQWRLPRGREGPRPPPYECHDCSELIRRSPR